MGRVILVDGEAFTPEEWEAEQRRRAHDNRPRPNRTAYFREWRARNRDRWNAYKREWKRRRAA